jgi:hypothetical protein
MLLLARRNSPSALKISQSV